MPKYHFLKTWPGPFQFTLEGAKNFEIRKNDRHFRIGEYLVLCEYSMPEKVEDTKGHYTGRFLIMEISHIVQGQYGLPADICVMALKYEGRS